MAPGITESDRETIEEFLGKPKYCRRPEDLLPADGEDDDDH
jgi:hypothetical protein